MSCDGCRIVRPTCKKQLWQATHTRWHGHCSHKLVDSHYAAFHGVQRSPAMKMVPTWGYRGVRVGEASNPDPAVTRQGRRLERSTQIDVSSDEEPLVRPNCGRHVVARRCVEEGVLSTVPATPVSLAQRGRQLLPSSDVVEVVEHVLAPGPDLAFTTLRDDSDADEEVERCYTQPIQPASAAALRSLGRGFKSNRFFSLATDSEDEEVERRTTLDEDSCSDTVSLIGRRNSRRRLRLRWSECVSIVAHSPGCEHETRVDTPDSHDERLRRVREALQRATVCLQGSMQQQH